MTSFRRGHRHRGGPCIPKLWVKERSGFRSFKGVRRGRSATVSRLRDPSQQRRRSHGRVEETRPTDVHGRRGSGILPLIPFTQSAPSRTGTTSVAATFSRARACGGDGRGGWARLAAGDAAGAAHTRAPSVQTPSPKQTLPTSRRSSPRSPHPTHPHSPTTPPANRSATVSRASGISRSNAVEVMGVWRGCGRRMSTAPCSHTRAQFIALQWETRPQLPLPSPSAPKPPPMG